MKQKHFICTVQNQCLCNQEPFYIYCERESEHALLFISFVVAFFFFLFKVFVSSFSWCCCCCCSFFWRMCLIPFRCENARDEQLNRGWIFCLPKLCNLLLSCWLSDLFAIEMLLKWLAVGVSSPLTRFKRASSHSHTYSFCLLIYMWFSY